MPRSSTHAGFFFLSPAERQRGLVLTGMRGKGCFGRNGPQCGEHSFHQTFSLPLYVLSDKFSLAASEGLLVPSRPTHECWCKEGVSAALWISATSSHLQCQTSLSGSLSLLSQHSASRFALFFPRSLLMILSNGNSDR